MATLALLGFTGEIPRLLPRLLPDTAATEAFNTRLDDGGLTPIRKPRFAHFFSNVPESGYQTIYKHQDDWLGWSGDVYAVPGPVAADRLYIFGDGAPKMRVNGDIYPLAITSPSGALNGVVSGDATSDLNSTRLYVYTNVTQFGEESVPSPISNEVNWFPGQTVTLSGFSTSMGAGRTASKQRIYRSQTGTTGTNLFFIAEREASNGNFVDNVPLESIQEPLPSLHWNAPVDTLTGVISMPNGMMAGFSGKDVFFCEPYIPHAWPEMYSMTVDYQIVALASYGSTLVVMTEGHPYIMTGSAPENMMSEKLELNLPCINAKGVQDMGYSVIYPSHDGLVSVSNSGATVISSSLMSPTEWEKYNPRAMISGVHAGRYLSCYRYSSQDLLTEFSGTIIFDVTGTKPFIIRSDLYPDAMFYDMVNGLLYYLDGSEVYIWDAPGQFNELQYWKSKEFVLPKPTNFGAILIETVDALTEDEKLELQLEQQRIEDENQVLIDTQDILGSINSARVNDVAFNGDILQVVPSLNTTVSVSIFADGEHVITLGTTDRMARLPSGFLARTWEVAVLSDRPILQITLATTGAELMQV
jgi:hypothetical protein